MTNKIEIPEKAYDLYDEFVHGRIERRDFFSGLSKVAVGGITAATLLQNLMPNYAQAEQVSFNDPDIVASYQKFSSPLGHGEGEGYLVKPSHAEQPLPTVLVIHENRGLNPYIKDVARRFAKLGFLAFAPDGLYPVGRYPGNDEQGKQLQRNMDSSKLREDFIAAAQFIKQHPLSNGQLGVTGFCYGGGMTNELASLDFALADAAAPFYGAAPALQQVTHIRCPILIHMAENDGWVNKQWEGYHQALKKSDANYQFYFYPGTRHGFHNDSTPRYSPEAAELAWRRTVDFFRIHLTQTNEPKK